MKYSHDGPFRDPVVRCDSCSKLVLMAHIKQFGQCSHCGNRKVRNVTIFNEQEHDWMVDQDVDPEFLGVFEAVEDGT